MFPLRAVLPRIAHIRTFHSPFVVLNATNRLAATPHHSSPPIYEKQHDTSPEPHLSSSGTRTYVVSEPDPSNTPYQVPSGAYPASTSYLNVTSPTPPIPEGLHTSNTRAVSNKEAGVGQSAAARKPAASGETDRRSPMDAGATKPGRL